MIIRNKANADIIILMDWHGEYTGEFDRVTGYEEGKWCRVKEVWDGNALSFLRSALGLTDDDDLINKVFRELFADRLDPALELASGDAAGVHLWEITGEGKSRAFDHLLDALNSAPSGDDDTFDYWPNTMEMLWEFACDLDELESGTAYRTRVRDQATRIHDGMIANLRDSGDRPFNDDDPYEMKGSVWLDWKGE